MAKRGPKPGTPQARNGGLATWDKYGIESYRAWGKQAGEANLRRRGPAFFAEIGRKGGAATKERMGTEHYRRIGAIGGATRAPREEQDGA